MQVNWRERLAYQPRLQQFSEWPVISVDTLPKAHRRGFLRNQQIVAQVLAGAELKKVAQQHQVSPGRISQILDRCLGGEESIEPALTRALIPYQGIGDRQRQQPLPTLAHNVGTGYAFLALLDEVPDLRKNLDKMIKAHLNDNANAQRLTPAAFHGEVKRSLAAAHWPHDRYPYTCESLAYEAARRYLHQRTAELKQAQLAKSQPPPRDMGATHPRYRALRATQIDEQVIDFEGRVQLQLNEELIPLRVARGSVLIAIDVDSSCLLGFYLAPTAHPNQEDFLTLVDHCIKPWSPPVIQTPGLSFLPGAIFPSGLASGFPISFGQVQLDNALMHIADSIKEVLAVQFGAALSFGPPGMPKIRQLIESVFDYLNQHCSHRMPSTSGSSVVDPKKESRKNKKRPPVVTFQTLNEALCVILTEYNVTPQAALGGATPLALFQHHCDQHYVRYIPEVLRRQIQPLMSSKEVVVHWNQDESRLPHVNFYYVRYQGPGLIKMIGKEKHIRVVFDRRDIRTLHAYTLSGDDLGELKASASWQRFAHSLATRQWIHKNTKQFRFNARDPLAAYFHHLLEHKHQPESALSLLRVYNEYTSGATQSLELPTMTEKDNPSQPQWRTNNANRRG